jgi:hypothetical protein
MQANRSIVRSRENIISIFVYSFLLSFIFVSSSRAQSEVYTKWVARWDAAHARDEPSAMAVDGKGNTFVTGFSCFANPCTQGALTIKYDSKGNTVWRAWLSSGTGVDIAVDAAGNVYVLYAYGGGLLLAKYTPTGVRQWVGYIPSTSSTRYGPVKLAVSSAGTSYLTMTAQPITNPPSVTVNVITAKYDTNGNHIWSKQAPTAANTNSTSVGVGLDTAENVYVLVFSNFNTQIENSFILKYNANGTLLNNYGGDKLGEIKAFHVDASGNSYVAGGGIGSPPIGAQDRVVAKFSSSGTLDWLHDFGAEASYLQSGFADLAISSTGNIFVAQTLPGSIPSSGGTDISIVKFNSTGTIQWTTRYNGRSDDSGGDQAFAIKVNSGDYTYVTGSSSNPSETCCFVELATVKYDPNGKQLWAARYNSNGGAPVALALSGGDVLVTGISNGATTGQDWATIDYVQDAAKVSPTSLSFGNQKVGTVSASKTVILTNTAEVPLAITGISITGEFEVTNNCPSSLAAGATCTLGVKFAPTQLGGLAGTVTVHDNWSGSAVHPQTVQLTGTGTT